MVSSSSTQMVGRSMPPAQAARSKRRRVNELLIALTAIATPAAAFQTAGLPLRVRRPSISARGTPVAQAHLWQPPTGRRRPATLASAEQSRLPRPRAWARWVPRVLAVIAVTPSALWAAGVPVRAVLPPNTWTIPLVAGVLNMVTNKLAVKMMFYPLRFVTAAPSNLGPSDSGAAALEALVPLRSADARCPAAHSAALAAWAGTASCRPRRCPWLTTSSITSCYASSTLARSLARPYCGSTCLWLYLPWLYLPWLYLPWLYLLWLYLPWLHLLCLALHLPSRCTWQVFTRLPPEELAASLDSTVLRVGREIAAEIGTDPKGRAKAWAPLIDAAVRDARFNETLLAHSRPLFAAVVRAPYYGATYRDAAYYCHGRGGVPPAIATRGCSPMCYRLQPYVLQAAALRVTYVLPMCQKLQPRAAGRYLVIAPPGARPAPRGRGRLRPPLSRGAGYDQGQ